MEKDKSEKKISARTEHKLAGCRCDCHLATTVYFPSLITIDSVVGTGSLAGTKNPERNGFNSPFPVGEEEVTVGRSPLVL